MHDHKDEHTLVRQALNRNSWKSAFRVCARVQDLGYLISLFLSLSLSLSLSLYIFLSLSVSFFPVYHHVVKNIHRLTYLFVKVHKAPLHVGKQGLLLQKYPQLAPSFQALRYASSATSPSGASGVGLKLR